jgi:diguanylate cyclase (GGDEF)-like protein
MTESNLKRIRLFVASPNEIKDEIDIIKDIVQEINFGIAHEKKIYLELIRWETHSYPSIGEDAQDVINKQLPIPDIFIGILWTRFGTPTKRAESGTKEEFDRAYLHWKKHKWPQILFYFRVSAASFNTPEEADQYGKVLKFKLTLGKSGFLYWEYRSLDKFRTDLQRHLTKLILNNKIIPQTNTDEQKIITSIENIEDLTIFLGKLDSILESDNNEVSIIYSDIDDLGIYNEKHGKKKGDIVIKEFSKSLKSITKHKGYSFRVSGDEFAIILPNHTKNEALATAGRMVNEFRQIKKGEITASFGVCTTDNRIKDSQNLFEFARQAVFISKRTGKDRITHFPFNEKQNELLIFYDDWYAS